MSLAVPSRLDRCVIWQELTANAYQNEGAEITDSLVSRSFCNQGCCLPCPFEEFLFPSVYYLFRVFDVIELISLVTLILLVLSFFVLPRGHNLTTPVAASQLIGLMFIQCGGLFMIGQNPENTLCSNKITLATQYTNVRCAIQGVLMIFGTYASCLTMFIRLLQLHLQIVWSHNPASFKSLNGKVLAMVALPYMVALIASLSALFLGDIDYNLAHRCGPNAETVSGYMYWPMCFVGLASAVLHFWTCLKIVLVYKKQKHNVRMKGSYVGEDTDESDFPNESLSKDGGTKLRRLKGAVGRKRLYSDSGSSPNQSVEGFWKIPNSPEIHASYSCTEESELSIDSAKEDIKVCFQDAKILKADEKPTALYQINEDEVDQLEMPESQPDSTAQLTVQQLRQQREILTKIRPVRTIEERRHSLMLKLWNLNWRSAKLTLVGVIVLWMYAISCLMALHNLHYVKTHPQVTANWLNCVKEHGPTKCQVFAAKIQRIWRQVMIDGVRALLGLSITINEVTRAQYVDQVREMWRWRGS